MWQSRNLKLNADFAKDGLNLYKTQEDKLNETQFLEPDQ